MTGSYGLVKHVYKIIYSFTDDRKTGSCFFSWASGDGNGDGCSKPYVNLLKHLDDLMPSHRKSNAANGDFDEIKPLCWYVCDSV